MGRRPFCLRWERNINVSDTFDLKSIAHLPKANFVSVRLNTKDRQPCVNDLEYSQETVENLDLLNKYIRKYFGNKQPNTPASEHDRLIKDIDLSEVDNRLLRFPDYKINKYYHWLGPKYDYIYSFTRHLLPPKMQIGLDNIMRALSYDMTESFLLNELKDFGTFLLEKVINQKEDLYLYTFVELHYVSGYDTYHHRSYNMFKDTKPFLVGRYLNKEYHERYYKNIRDTIDLMLLKVNNHANFKDWLKYRDNWAIMGSCNIGKKMTIETPGFDKPSKINSKFTNTCLYSDDQLYELCTSYRPHEIKPFLKSDESAKARIVLGYDTVSYIRCCYLESLIDNFNGSQTWTSVGFDPNKMFDVRARFDQAFDDPTEILICTDQSAFDQHQYKDAFIYAFDYLATRIGKINKDAKMIRDLEMYGLAHAYFNIDGKKEPWRNGLCSGHKFTALLGSVLNRADTLTAADISGQRDYIKYCIFQGDDATLICNKGIDKEKFLKAYNQLGMIVNPMKTWYCDTRTEYLHQTYVKGQVFALPTRSVLGMIFKDPTSSREIPDSYFQSMISNFNQAERRSLYIRPLLYYFCKRQFERFGSQKMKHIKDYLHTPKCVGGGGFVPYTNRKNYLAFDCLKQKMNKDLKSKITSNYNYQIPGVNVSDYILKHVYDHLPAPNIKSTFILKRVSSVKDTVSKNGRLVRYPSNYTTDLADNTQRWLQHVRELTSEASPFQGISVTKYSKSRKMKDSFDICDSFSDWLKDTNIRQEFRTVHDRLINSYVQSKRSINLFVSVLNYYKLSLLRSNMELKNYVTNYRLFF